MIDEWRWRHVSSVLLDGLCFTDFFASSKISFFTFVDCFTCEDDFTILIITSFVYKFIFSYDRCTIVDVSTLPVCVYVADSVH